MNTDLVTAEPHQIQVLEIAAFETIRKNQDMAEIASHFNLSFEQTVRLTRFRIYLAIRAGQLYAALPDANPGELVGRGRNRSSTELTSKQAAELTLGKSRQTISQWVKMADVEDPYDRADEYCDRYKDEDHRKAIVDEPTLKGYYHWLFGIIASHHTGNQENYTPTDILEEYISPLIERFMAFLPASACCLFVNFIKSVDEFSDLSPLSTGSSLYILPAFSSR